MGKTSIECYRERRAWLDQYKAERGCQECGEDDPKCLDLHHTDPTTKRLKHTHAMASGLGMQSMKDEVEKCFVLCSNCHRKLGVHGRHLEAA